MTTGSRVLWGFFGTLSGALGLMIGGIFASYIYEVATESETAFLNQIREYNYDALGWIIFPLMIVIGLLTLAGVVAASNRMESPNVARTPVRNTVRCLLMMWFGMLGLLTALCIHGNEGVYLAYIFWPFMLTWSCWQMLAHASKRGSLETTQAPT